VERGNDSRAAEVNGAIPPRRTIRVDHVLRMRRPAFVERSFGVGDDRRNRRPSARRTPGVLDQSFMRFRREQHGTSLGRWLG
jgi:hypothetical protein